MDSIGFTTIIERGMLEYGFRGFDNNRQKKSYFWMLCPLILNYINPLVASRHVLKLHSRCIGLFMVYRVSWVNFDNV